jgi:endonuclease YncB( thermonuclease family)
MVAFATSRELPEYSGKVVGVTDGDTVTVLDGELRQHKIRLADIDAPEKGQPFGTRAKAELGEMVFGKEITVRPTTKDRYGREVAALYLGDQIKSVNLWMVEKGMAWWYIQYSKDPAFQIAERQARSGKAGLWADPDPVPPWEWRKSGHEKPAPVPPSRKKKKKKKN